MDDNKKEKENQEPLSPDWAREPGYSGWRSRCRLSEGDLFAYDDGRWEVIMHGRRGYASGAESSPEAAKSRTIMIFGALVWILENISLKGLCP